jgi:hypothetical protein
LTPPPESTTVVVCDKVGGQQYTARWHGQRFGWELVSFTSGFTPAAKPAFWLDYN